MRIFDSTYNNLDIGNVRKDLETVGWTLLSANGLPQEQCEVIKKEIDALAEAPDTEINYGGSEHRVWKANEKSAVFEEFREFSDKVMSSVEKEEKAAFNILAIRNRALLREDAELIQGRWHLDSLRRQLKIFVFLTDVTEKSGPFEMIPGSHRTSFKIRHALKGDFFTPKDILNGSRKYQHLKETLIERIVASGHERKAFTIKAGTIAMVDTSCVHRARPCLKGERYALTSYYH